jgi:hypothetical protein
LFLGLSVTNQGNVKQDNCQYLLAAKEEEDNLTTVVVLDVLLEEDWWSLIGDIWAIIHIVQSRSSPGAKALWVVLVLVLPLLGLVIWFFAGPRSGSSAG